VAVAVVQAVLLYSALGRGAACVQRGRARAFKKPPRASCGSQKNCRGNLCGVAGRCGVTAECRAGSE